MTGPAPRRHVLIVGAMKSGTTTLFSLLAAHPRIAAARPKEPGYFAFDDVAARGADWYEGLFGFDPARHDWRLEASTDYTKAPFADGVRARMAAHPDAAFRLIYIMRHPLRRIESHARHTQVTGKEVGQIPSPRADHGLDSGVSLPSLAVARYAAQIDVYADLWAAGEMHLVALEDLQTDPARVMAGIWTFLGLEPPPLADALPQANRARTGRMQMVRGWDRLARTPLMPLGRRLLPERLRRAIRAGLHRRVEIEGRFALHPEEERLLLGLLAPDLLRLRDVYGVEVERLWGLRPERLAGADADAGADAGAGADLPNRV
ncbi:sulfotransferase family protein [Oceaniovalibus guishaninsula]|uniref:sulfotransferase family protein n=1 Tax=Oceaniovalibus guishaninsula TaxID=1046117 RepID=UPI0012EA7F06|nr:sulfotransferase [Oceaniovalibus guishaninsula]